MGPKFDSSIQYMPAYAWDETSPYFGQQETWTNHFDPDDFFRNSVTNTTNASFQRSGKDYSIYTSMSTSNIGGVLPNSSAQRRWADFTSTFSPMENLTVKVSYKYNYRKNHNAALEGYDEHNPYADFLQWGNTNVDVAKLKDYLRPDGSIRTWNITEYNDFTPAFHDSPYAVYDLYNHDTVRQYHNLSGDLEYSLPFNIKIGWKTTANIFNQKNKYEYAKLTGVTAYDESRQYSSTDIYNQARITWSDQFVDDRLSLAAAAFAENRYYHYDRVDAFTRDGLLIPGFYSTSNSNGLSGGADNYTNRQKTQSIFGTLTAGWDDTYYIEGSLRNDWNSTLPKDKNSYLYGGLSVSAIASNWFKHGDWLRYWKLRASFAQVGSALNAYQTSVVNYFGTRYASTATLYPQATLVDPGLKPAITTSYEVGTEFSLFGDRLHGDLNFYRRDTKNQIISVATSAASGYSSRLLNAGLVRNSGVEFTLGGTPIKMKNIQWDINLNLAHNVNKVVRLTDDLERYQLGYFSFGYYLYNFAEVGKPMGALYTYRTWKRTEDGKRIVRKLGDGSYYPVADNSTETYLGNTQPKLTGGISTSFRIYDFTISASADFRFGGKIASITNMWLEGSGLAQKTAGKNDLGNELRTSVENGGGIRVDGAVANSDGTYTYGTYYMDAQTYYQNSAPFFWENYVYTNSYIKMRELAVAYNVPVTALQKLHLGLRRASVSFVATNPFLIWSKVPNIDPSEAGTNIYEQGQTVSTRSFGFSVNLTF